MTYEAMEAYVEEVVKGLWMWQLQRASPEHFLEVGLKRDHDRKLIASFQKSNGMQFVPSFVHQAPTGFDTDWPIAAEVLEELMAMSSRSVPGLPLLAGVHCASRVKGPERVPRPPYSGVA